MASISPTSCISQREIPSKLWFTKEELDQPYDVTLVVRDGELRAYGKVLSEASPFFEKLLNTDMKESKEEVVRLEIFTDSVMRNTLEFIYTGNVQILDEDDARDLVVIADYLLLKNLKTPARQTLLKELNTSNCTSIFHLADEYHCDELLCKTKYLSLQISEHYSLRSVKMFCKCPKRNLQFLFQAMSYMLAPRKMCSVSF